MMYLNRGQWGAEYDVGIRPPMTLPAPDLWVHHTVTFPTDNPAADMRAIERIDIGRFGYPSYSWVVHPSGVVLEGMGTRKGAHTYNHNSTSFGVSFIGNFENDTPTAAALDAFVDLCRDLIARNWLRPGAPTGGHRDVYPTACPGAHLYPLIPDLRRRVASGTPAPAPPQPPEDSMVRLMKPARVTDDNGKPIDGVGEIRTVWVVPEDGGRWSIPDEPFLADYANRFGSRILPATKGGPTVDVVPVRGVQVEVVNPFFLRAIPAR